MAKKKINIVLILFVLGLWGTVAYKALSQYFFSEEIKATTATTEYNFSDKKVERDTFRLEKIGRDPFLNKALVRAEKSNTGGGTGVATVRRSIPVKTTVAEKPKEIKNWPVIGYYGYIKSGDKNELVMLKVGNSIHRVRKGQEVDGLVLNKVFKDSVEVSFNKEKKIIRKG
ncbi:hypothetical protein [Flavobacterium cerinum]|uniref:Type IV pilus biogenesis protein PilP n=1 Tax=Flavobacterium cerinum TaxID=2502784 RepID=A0ABY5IUL3_9FLAO|nr:hypothetical protein [Flavobacterium cerinum]UUC46512.1 hypothetical protein NOX80_04755 [Flavobacterium cerinum]